MSSDNSIYLWWLFSFRFTARTTSFWFEFISFSTCWLFTDFGGIVRWELGECKSWFGGATDAIACAIGWSWLFCKMKQVESGLVTPEVVVRAGRMLAARTKEYGIMMIGDVGSARNGVVDSGLFGLSSGVITPLFDGVSFAFDAVIDNCLNERHDF